MLKPANTPIQLHNSQTLAGSEGAAAPDDSGAELVEDDGATAPAGDLYVNDFNLELFGEDTGASAPEYMY